MYTSIGEILNLPVALFVNDISNGGDIASLCQFWNRLGGGIGLPDNGACAELACVVETRFALSIMPLFLQQSMHFIEFSHGLGFNPDTECVVNGSPLSDKIDERACCGQHPYRFPYKTFEGSRDCCGSKTYAVGISNCCYGQLQVASC